jgi:hypothetical protein
MVLDPEKLLWVPGQRSYFLPSTTSAMDLSAINGVLKNIYLPRIKEMLNTESIFFRSIPTVIQGGQ